MLKKFFTIDYSKLVQLLVPTDFRSAKMIAWLQAGVVPLKMVYQGFMNNRGNNLYALAHNGQVCFLRKALNDFFDPVLRRIVISDGNKYQRQYIFTSAELQPEFLGVMYLRQSDDYADTGVDFIVVVPVGFDLTGNYHQLKAMVEFYKLASKRFKIEFENE